MTPVAWIKKESHYVFAKIYISQISIKLKASFAVFFKKKYLV